MAFETGVSLSPSDLLSKLVTRLTTDGWTIIRTNGSPGTQVSISDGSAAEANQFNFLADDTAAVAAIDCQPSRADGGIGASFFAHTGSPDASGASGTFCSIGHRTSATDQGFSGSHTAYFFFTGSTPDGRYAHVVVEGTAGVFFHLYFGTIAKAGTFTGGQYMTALHVTDAGLFTWPFEFNEPGLRAKSWIRCDEFFTSISVTTDGGVSRWHEAPGMAHNNVSSSNYAANWYQGGLQNFNQRSPFGPNLCIVWNAISPSATSTAHKIIGHTPDLRLVSMDGREPGEIVIIGGDNWRIFPAHRKTTDGTSTTSSAYINTFVGGPAPNNDSNLAGFALLEVP
ncbi:MAG: hypothetical protein V3T08_10120 [Gemmatimonadota bacterium]